MPDTHSHPPPVVGALTTLVERWVSQDVARHNAAAAASRLRRQRAELEDVDLFLTARRHGVDVGTQTRGHRAGAPTP